MELQLFKIKKSSLKNLTPHPIVIHTENGVLEIPPSGDVARVEFDELQTTSFLVEDDETGEVYEIPCRILSLRQSDKVISPSQELKITSLPYAMTFYGFAPDTDKGAVRDEKGQIVGVRGLVLILPPIVVEETEEGGDEDVEN